MSLQQLREKIQKFEDDIVKTTNGFKEDLERLIGTRPSNFIYIPIKKENKLKGKKQVKRPKNKGILSDAIKSIIRLNEGKVNTNIITEDLLNNGWKTNSKKFRDVVHACLSSHKKEFKKDDDGYWIIIT